MTDATQYNHLLPMGENSDEDWNADDEDPSMYQPTIPTSGMNAPDVEIHDTDALLNKKRKVRNGTPYEYSRSRNRRRDSDGTLCTPTRAAVFFASMLLLFGVGYFVGFMTPFGKGTTMTSVVEVKPDVSFRKRSENWRTKMTDWGTESCIRLVDVDQDGVLDIVAGIALGKDVTTMVTESDMAEFCRNNGMKLPCAGAVVALRGRDGKLLWKASAYAEVFELLCHGIDVNQDGKDDCIATGRLGSISAIDPLNGKTLWVGDERYVNRGWNIYAPAAVPDLDDDGVADLIIAHGGDPTVAAEITHRKSNHIILVSGRTGKAIGTYFKTPNEKESYMSPVIHKRKDGSQYVLIGTGGETVDGELLAMSLPDFYRHVRGLSRDHPVPNTQGQYTQWGFKKPNADGSIMLLKSERKGVMVPPVLIDMNKDGVNDILVNSFNGIMILYDGETLAPMWKIQFEDRESYSTPAPGYFNDDDVIDFMVHWSVGAWPFYNSTDTVIIDGRDGSILWNLTTNKYDVSSDLVARTTARNRDVFIFRAQGREGHDLRNTGAIHGATGIQRIINKRVTDNGDWTLEDTEITAENEDQEGILLQDSHFRYNRAVIDKDYVECESDQRVFLAELFALDRTVMKKPIKLWQRGSEKYFYKLTEKDKIAVKETIKKYGANHTMTENEVPWSRGKREKQTGNTKDSFCILTQPDERTTGAVGDVDGDGKLDVIVNLVSVGVLRDEYARYVKMKFTVDIFKLSLEDAIKKELYVPVNVTVHEKMAWVDNENKITTLKFLPMEKQPWGGYMGTRGDSIYHI
ncbi:protein FAM234A-like [Ruditapes philippinarum]|uniref:protein FAM234A-like n=1 Tax=Ruditapes philippinarum TaxID=129788 RepID=UPI00295C0AAA|nr:protein FAM234A-like [Ruditapes philippinarum]